MGTRLCLIATDAISFNVLYEGQLEFLRQAGLDLTMICGGGQEQVGRLRQRQVGRVLDLGFVRPPSPIRDGFCMVRLMAHLLVNRYDIVLCTTPKAILLGSVASWFACQQNRVVFFQGRVYENAKGLVRRFYAGLDRLAIALSTRAIFVSRSLLDAYEAEGLVSRGQGEVVGAGSVNGVDPKRFSAAQYDGAGITDLKQTLKIAPDDLVALTVGRICHDKGLDELVLLAEALAGQGIVFVVVGPVEPGNEAAASALFSKTNVRHVPFTQDMPRYFALADVHLFLSHREGFGNVAVEAASCGVPTIAFDVVGVRDSVGEGVSGVRVPAGNLAAVKSLLEEARGDIGAFRSRFHGARAWAQSLYAREQVWRAFLAFYQEVR